MRVRAQSPALSIMPPSIEGSINVKGADTKYNPVTSPQLAGQYFDKGFTVAECCRKMQISRQTFYNWRKRHPEFETALTEAKKAVDDVIEQKLYKRAIGFRYTETTRERVGGKMTITKKVSKTQPPEVIAMIFWLKNRRPDQWRDRKDFHHDGAIKVNLDSVIYEAVHGNAIGRAGGNGKSVSANVDN